MKLILSRKGFDSSAGGCPSPILPDGRLLSLPIPDTTSNVRYSDLQYPGVNSGRLVSQLSRGRVKGSTGAHIDPDLDRNHLSRASGWRPLLGQTGSAQGHLRKQEITTGDLFLFFGLFRDAEIHNRRWRFVPGSRPRHIIWGWMSIGEILNVDSSDLSASPWLNYHPHLQGGSDANNTLYLSAESLALPGINDLPASGVFTEYHSELQLTHPDSPNPSAWRLPEWFYPEARTPLSYHAKPERWSRDEGFCRLQSAARGQEFVLDVDQYPELTDWCANLLRHS